MGTRATYCFSSEYKPATTVYIHWDGYPDGAAAYLLNAIKHVCHKGDSIREFSGLLTVETFIRANEGAEITSGHDAHGDTDYRYDVDLKSDTVVVRKRSKTPIWTGSIAQFINTFSEYTKEVVRKRGSNQWATLAMAKACAKKQRAKLRDYKAKFPQAVGNFGGMELDVKRAEEFVREFSAASAPTVEAGG